MCIIKIETQCKCGHKGEAEQGNRKSLLEESMIRLCL